MCDIFLLKDGVTMNINHTEPNAADVIFPRNFLTNIHLGRCAYAYKGRCSSPGAKFADFNVWSRAMTEGEMQVAKE